MELYRITQEKYANDLSGNGARLFGGRWNNEGIFALYTSSSRSLALLETLAHTPAKILQVKPYLLVTILLPDTASVLEVNSNKFPSGWDGTEIRPITQKTGDTFLLTGKSLAMAVPSILMPEELNFVLNPQHPEFKKVKITHQRRIHFDKRIAMNL